MLDNLHFPEGPAFDKKGALWFVEQNNGSLNQYYKGILYRHYVGGRPNGIAIDHRDLIWFCDSIKNEIRVYNPSSTATYTILSKIGESPLNLPNDLAFDHLGNLLFTCSGSELKKGDGYFCAWNARMGLHKIDSVRYYPNGLAFNKGNNKLYIAETGTHRIWKGDWDSVSFSWSNPEACIMTGGPVGPDGMAFDENGGLYVAVFGSSSVHVYNDAGILDRKIDLPGSNPTNCAFDPFGRLGLIITEAENGQLLSYKSDQKGII
nr:SMP-30/gluconolactonase/LRE family protein [Arenibacter sp. S6351L]